MGSNCAAPVADSFLLSYERHSMSPFDNNQADVIESFNSTGSFLTNAVYHHGETLLSN